MSLNVTFPNFETARVLVVGDVILDRYWRGPTDRVSPEAPIPVVKVEDVEERVGGAGNVALNIASLGSQVKLLGITGADEAAEVLKNKLSSAEVKCDFQKIATLPTVTKLRVMSRSQQLLRLDFEKQLDDPVALDAQSSAFEKALDDVDIVVASDYAKGSLSKIETLIAMANKKNVPILIDPKGTDFSRYRGANIVKPNYSEFEAVVGPCAHEEDIVLKGKALMKEYQWDALLITRSEHGMTLLQAEKDPMHIPVQGSEVYDVTGAGDTVIATLAAALASGEKIEAATFLANYAASIVVGKVGTAAIGAHELRRQLQNNSVSGRGIVTEEQLKILVADSQAHDNERIVMTNGCFDIIHAGHISYLQEAKALGDRLIVAVNSDESVRRLKGDSRPINPVDRRMAVLAGLEAVDWVVDFGEDTPGRLVENILPDVLVKGGDWKVEEIAGGEAVVKNGGEVMSLSFENGCSTTAIIDLIKERESS